MQYENPYTYIDPVSDDMFVGRHDEVNALTTRLTQLTGGSFALFGGRRIGKTSQLDAISRALNKIANTPDSPLLPVGLVVDVSGGDVYDVESFFRVVFELLHDIVSKNLQIQSSSPYTPDNPPLRAHDFGTALTQFGEAIFSQRGRKFRLILLLDECGEITGESWTSDLHQALRALIDSSRTRHLLKLVMAGSHDFLANVSQRTSPLWGSLIYRRMRVLDDAATIGLIAKPTGNVLPTELVNEIARQSGGHPYLTQYIMYHVWEHGLERVTEATVRSICTKAPQCETNFKSWVTDLGDSGKSVYRVLSSSAEPLSSDEIRDVIMNRKYSNESLNAATALEIATALDAACYTGLLGCDDDKYWVASRMFLNWFIRNEPRFTVEEVNSMNTKLDGPDKDRLIAIIAKQAANPLGGGPANYFNYLVARANLRDEWRQDIFGRWTGNANQDARALVDWAIGKTINPKNTNFTTLGSILTPLLSDVGFDEATEIASLITIYRQYLGADLERLIVQYQVPQPIPAALDSRDIGPEFEWRGPTDGEQLQSFWKPVPNYLDVGFLSRAVKQATSVCLVTLPLLQRTGTGFLITSNLVLTNYHVLRYSEDEDIEANARSLRLRFGFFTSSNGNPLIGQSFALDPVQPIVAFSPSRELDYALLRIDESITRANDLQPVEFDYRNFDKHSGINILQHPNGEEMKVVFNCNGVTGVYPDTNRVQYISQTAGGSSGAPCYSDDWKVVAIHRSQRSRSFGQIREGVLFSAIYSEISPHL